MPKQLEGKGLAKYLNQNVCLPGKIGKVLIRLELTDLQELQETAHAKSYIVDTSPKCAEYIFQKNGCSSFLIRCCLKKS